MNEAKQHPKNAADLRQQAEARLKEKHRSSGTEDSEHRSDADLRRLQHELEVHQIELEMQNEALVNAQLATEEALGRCSDLFDFAPTGYFNLDADGAILAVNLAGAKLAGTERSRLINRRFSTLVYPADCGEIDALLERTFDGTGRASCEVALAGNGAARIQVQIEMLVSTDGKEARTTVFDVTERRKLEAERERLIVDLQEALERVKQLSGMLPICASCKKIRDDQGYWSQIESYIASHSEATFTHGLCPECLPKFVPGYGETIETMP